MRIESIDSLNFDKLYKILRSSNLTDTQKVKFVYKNKTEIDFIIEKSITDDEFKWLMQNRALKKFRPLKNSYTKRGDKIILATALNIETSDVPKYIKNVTLMLKTLKKLSQNENINLEKLRQYVYRHGKQDELVMFFENELINSKNIKNTINKNLNYNTGGIADYFVRPVHRMKNITMIELFNIIDRCIVKTLETGYMTEEEAQALMKYSLLRLYQIQQNSKFLNAIKC